MREILLTQNKATKVDDADYNWLNQWKWYAYDKEATKQYGEFANLNQKLL